MVRLSSIQTNFTAGELSPLLYGRTDLAKYANGAKTLLNAIVQPHGGVTRRPGTRYVASVKDSASPVRLAPFQFSTEQAYVLEFGDRYLRFFRNEGAIRAEPVSATITNGGFDVDAAGWTDRSIGSAAIAQALLGVQSEGTFAASNASGYVLGDGVANARNIGLKFRNSVAGSVAGVTIDIQSVSSSLNAVARIYTDSSGQPGIQLGTDSDTLALTATGEQTFVWGGAAPGVAAETDYWVIVSDISGALGQVELHVANDQGPQFESGRHDVIASIDDGSGAFSTANEWRIRIDVQPADAEGVLALVGAGGAVAVAEQEVAIGEPGTEHLLAFRVLGNPGDDLRVRIGTASGGRDLLDDFRALPGWHVVAFSTSAASVYVQFRNRHAKTVYVDDVAFFDDTPVELPTRYGAGDLFALKLAQSADVLFIAHPGHPPYRLERRGHAAWSLVAVDFADGPYLEEHGGATTLTPAAASGLAVTVTASQTEGINADRGFLSTDIGRSLRLKHGTTWGWATITEHLGPTQVKVDVRADFGGTGAVTAWRLGAWSQTTGYPACVTFHEQRLCWAGETGAPQTFRASKSSDFENMAPTTGGGAVEDDSALNYAIGANQVNAIRWMSSGRSLVLGTTGGTWPVRANSLDDPLTPTNVQIKRANSFGGADVAPIEVGDVVVYLSPTGRKFRELAFLVERDNFAAPDLTILAEHVSRTGIVQMAHAPEPYGIIWAVRRDGGLIALTYEREHEVVSWHRHVLGGTLDGGAPRVESVAVIPAPDGGFSQVWLAVKRTINGAPRRCIEILAGFLADDEEAQDAYFVDCGLTLDDPRTVTGATRTDPVVLTVPGHGFANGDSVDLDGLGGMTELNGKRFTAMSATADGFALSGVDGTGYGAYQSGGVARKAVSAVSGLAHLEGETISVVADGVVQGPKTVLSGAITLDSPASRVHAGYGYATDIETLRFEAPVPGGTAQTRTKRIDHVVLRLHRSRGATAGPQSGRLDDLDLASGNATTDVALFSGDREMAFPGGFDADGHVFIRQDQPLPLSVLSVIARINIAAR